MSMRRLAVVLATVALAACGTARKSAPLGTTFVGESPTVQQGEGVFMRACHSCHPGGEAGLGPALNDKPLPGFLIALQVRQGLGAMPAFSNGDVSETELDALVAYLAARRAQ